MDPQVAIAVAFCVVLASWAAAEVLSVLSLLRKRQARASSFRQLPKVEAEEQDVFEVAPTVWASTHWDETVTRTYTVEVFLEGLLPPLRCASELAVIIVCVYLSDRTDVFAKSPLQDHSGLWGVCSALFLAALCTTTRLWVGSGCRGSQTHGTSPSFQVRQVSSADSCHNSSSARLSADSISVRCVHVGDEDGRSREVVP